MNLRRENESDRWIHSLHKSPSCSKSHQTTSNNSTTRNCGNSSSSCVKPSCGDREFRLRQSRQAAIKLRLMVGWTFVWIFQKVCLSHRATSRVGQQVFRSRPRKCLPGRSRKKWAPRQAAKRHKGAHRGYRCLRHRVIQGLRYRHAV